jgi:Gram-negative bacterial TonB protein C-terminal
MPIDTSGSATGTMDPVEVKYLALDPDGSPVSIHMHRGAMDGLAQDIAESIATPAIGAPNREIGGLLLGRIVAGPRPAVWIERYHRIACEHRFGPQFILDTNEIKALEEAAAGILAAGELAVVGLYRSHARSGFQLEESDFELIRRYFSDPSDLILLIKPQDERNISGQFLAWDAAQGAHPVGEEIKFREGPAIEPVLGAAAAKTESPVAAHEFQRRLVPDFLPSPVEPAPSLYGLGQSFLPEETTKEHETREPFKKWLPLVAALLLVGGIVWLLVQQSGHGPSNPAAPASAQPAQVERPLGLYVDPAGQNWRVLWNPNATALHDARNVQLFVRDKDDQNLIPLSERDRASGSYQYRPTGNDVTFRLEVVDKAGRVSAESFRMQVVPSAPVAAAAPAPPPAPGTAARITPPKAIYKAPPVIAAGVRPRIKGTVPIDVRVQIDARGHVVSATPVAKQRSGLDEYLAGRAVQAARLWRFEPARENGKPVAGTQILHFVFER